MHWSYSCSNKTLWILIMVNNGSYSYIEVSGGTLLKLSQKFEDFFLLVETKLLRNGCITCPSARPWHALQNNSSKEQEWECPGIRKHDAQLLILRSDSCQPRSEGCTAKPEAKAGHSDEGWQSDQGNESASQGMKSWAKGFQLLETLEWCPRNTFFQGKRPRPQTRPWPQPLVRITAL